MFSAFIWVKRYFQFCSLFKKNLNLNQQMKSMMWGDGLVGKTLSLQDLSLMPRSYRGKSQACWCVLVIPSGRCRQMVLTSVWPGWLVRIRPGRSPGWRGRAGFWRLKPKRALRLLHLIFSRALSSPSLHPPFLISSLLPLSLLFSPFSLLLHTHISSTVHTRKCIHWKPHVFMYIA